MRKRTAFKSLYAQGLSGSPCFAFFLRRHNLTSVVHVTMHSSVVTKTLSAALFLIGAAHADGIYSKSSAVLQFDGKSYDKLIAKSNLVSVS